MAQCLMLPGAFERQLEHADKILEGRVVNQSSFVGQDGNIYTENQIEVYRVFKGDVGFYAEIITEGGVYGDLMQMVTPSVQLRVGDYGVMTLNVDASRSMSPIATTFSSIDERTGTVYGLKEATNREAIYELIARSTGTQTIEVRRMPFDMHESDNSSDRMAPQLSSVYPLEVTAGTQTVLTITGQGFGAEQGNGHVAFRNADDGGQSFVALQAGPHYLSWSDTEIQMYVPSATLYNNVVAGTGEIQVRADNGQVVTSTQAVNVDFAKSEVIYNQNLNNTMLVGVQNGGYVFHVNQGLEAYLGGIERIHSIIEKWSCNTGVNYHLSEETVAISDWSHDDVNVIGMSNSGQLPSYMLGRTITTFSGCGTAGQLQWNLIEVDILLNSDIDWWAHEDQPSENRFDLETSLLHELGHAHLLQHNNEEVSPMYFQLTSGMARRQLHAHSDIDGGEFVVHDAVSAESTCSEELHQPFNNSGCNLSLVNSVSNADKDSFNVFPNPFENDFVVTADEIPFATFIVFDSMGRSVKSGALNETQNRVTTSDLQSGVYLLEIRSDNERHAQRLVKN